ncbi:dual specificity protein phosphatase family protein [Halorientalis marina]|uniref:dual specificity protein phosphatase family protein n=1 Tax=Halorientalis marina TaxID=2931976 RepID=UPI001FF233C0|nr:dual specificity protein phosphatase [Halorientalis marina]
MDEICSGLFVGTTNEAGNEVLLRECGVDRVVSLTHGGPETGFPSGVSIDKVPMKDGPRNERDRFESAVEEVLSGLCSSDSVLVHCSRGASRSPAVAATALAIHRGISIDEAFKQVAAHREETDPHDALVRRAATASHTFQQ